MSEKPEAYVRGVWPFMGREFLTEQGTIYPREETAIVVDTLVELVKSGALAAPAGRPLQIVDVCGGSGNVGCVIALELPGARVWTTDLLERSSALARRNVARHGLEARVEVATGDLFRAIDGRGLEGQIDGISCSPPFISTGRLKERPDLLDHEPREAFDAGPYGISIHMRVLKEAIPVLRPGGYLVCEFGVGQAKQVEALARRQGSSWGDLRILGDREGTPRAICVRRAA